MAVESYFKRTTSSSNCFRTSFRKCPKSAILHVANVSLNRYGANRFRVHEAFNLIGEEVSWYAGQIPRSLEETNFTAASRASLALNYRTDLDVNYEPFTSWDDKNGPVFAGPGPDPYTEMLRWNLSDPLNPVSSGITVSGYGDRANLTQQPFAAENIIIVTDGYCASTCSIFSELMRQQGGVKFAVVGGRPTKDIAQAVGGTKGTNSIDGTAVLYYVQKPFQIQHFNDGDYYADQTALGNYTTLPFYRALTFGVNGRDGIRQGDEAGTPLQFVYEPADCRLYYTPAMAVDQSELWRAVADTAFNGVNECVAGSLGSSSNTVKRSVSRRQHISGYKDLTAHYEALATDNWVPASRKVLGGDCVMIQ